MTGPRSIAPPETNPRYTRVAIALHLLYALAILCTFLLSHIMTDLPLSPLKLKLYAYHKWIGVTIFLLVLARLAWRLAPWPPPPPAPMPAWHTRQRPPAPSFLFRPPL